MVDGGLAMGFTRLFRNSGLANTSAEMSDQTRKILIEPQPPKNQHMTHHLNNPVNEQRLNSHKRQQFPNRCNRSIRYRLTTG